MLPEPPRVAVVGTTGSEKTTVAKRLALALGAPHVEMDALHWGPNWTSRPIEEVQEQLAVALAGGRWVCVGNYSNVQPFVVARANALVWLDYPLRRVMWQLLARTVRRAVTRERLWSGNQERWRNFVSRDSIFLWALKTHGRRRRQYGAIEREPGRLMVVRLRSSGETESWLGRVMAEGAAGPDRSGGPSLRSG